MSMKELINNLAERLQKEADLSLEAYEKVEEERDTALARVKELAFNGEEELRTRIIVLECELEGVMDAIDRVLKGSLIKSDEHKGVSGYVSGYVEYSRRMDRNYSEYVTAAEKDIESLKNQVAELKSSLEREKALREAAETECYDRASSMAMRMMAAVESASNPEPQPMTYTRVTYDKGEG